MRTFAVCLLLAAVSAFAQSDRGTITGTVADPAGAVVASAPIQAKNVDTGATYDAATSATGNFTIPQLPAGNYELTVVVPGFKRYVRQNIIIEVAQVVRIDAALEVGSTTDSVTVSDAAPLLKTETGDLSHTISVKVLDDLPMWSGGAFRSMYNVAQIVPGVYQSTQELRISGAPNNTQSVRVEGQEANNSGIPATPMQGAQSVDAIQEVTIQTSNYAAEYGQAGGGVINMTMKSGTNQFHGSAYDYLVNEAFNAGRPFNTGNPQGNPRARARRHDYGFTAGGPIWIPKIYDGHDRSFFFFNYEQSRQTQTFNTVVNTVPTAAYRQGNFATAIVPGARIVGTDPLGRQMLEGMVYDPTTQRAAPDGRIIRDPFPLNAINPARFDPLSVKIQSLFPAPTGPQSGDIINNFQPVFSGTQTDTSYAFKFDQSIGTKGKLSYYYSHKNLSQPIATGNGAADGLPDPIGTYIASFIPTYTTRLNYDHSISPTTLLHLGAGFFEVQFNVPSVTTQGEVLNYDAQKELGLKGGIVYRFFPAISGISSTVGGGMKNIGSSAGNLQYTQRPTFNASMTIVKSNHSIKFGGELKIEGYPVNGQSNTTGSYVFNPAQTGQPFQQVAVNGANVGFGYASFLLGLVSSTSIAQPTYPRLGKNQTGLYIQDSWKVTRKFTLDYGLRYDYSTYLREQYGRAPFFSRTLPNPAVGNRPGAAIFEGTGPGRCGCSVANNYPWAFGPRLGFAYQINTKTVFRGGFGVVYNGTEQGNGYAPTFAGSSRTANAPFGEAVTTLSAGYPTQFHPPLWPNFDPGQFHVNPNPVAQTVGEIDQNAGRPARQYQWSAGFQRELTKDLVAEAEYVGNRGIWWVSNGQINLNALTPELLGRYGLDATRPADYALLTSTLSSAAAVARGFNRLPYPGFPTTGQTVAQSLRPYPQFTDIRVAFSPVGNTWYDSLQAKVTQRFSHGLSLLSTFSWSRTLTIGVERDPNPGTTGNATYNDVFNRKNNKYLSIYDSPFQFTVAGTYITPAFSSNKILRWIAKDWTYAAVLQYRAGLPMPVPFATQNPQLNALLYQGTFANRVPGEPLTTVDLNCHCYDPNKTYVLNPRAWAQPAVGTFGTSAGYYSDYRKQRRPAESMSFGRTFRIKERMSFNIQMQLTNVFNRAFYNDPRNSDIAEQRNTLQNGNVNPNTGFGAINTVAGVAGAGIPAIVNIAPRSGVLVGRFTF